MPETRTRILDAAAHAFAGKGFHRATIRQIAADANVNEVTVFRYFPEKSGLYWAAVDRKMRASNLSSMLETAVQASTGPADLVFSISSCIFRSFHDDKDLGRLLHFTVLELESEKRLLWEVLLKPLLDTVSSRLRVWIKGGQIRNIDPDTAARALLGFALSQHLVGIIDDADGLIASDRCVAEQVEISLFGLLPR